MRVNLWTAAGLACALVWSAGACSSGDDDDVQPVAGSGGAALGGTGGAIAAGAGGVAAGAGGMAGSATLAGAGGMAGSTMAGAGGMAGSAMLAGAGGMAGSTMAGAGGMAGSMMAGSGGMAGSMMAGTGGTLGGPLMYTGEFTMGTTIPVKNMCPGPPFGGTMMGDNKSPALSWSGGPADTKSFAIVLYDTVYNMLHWVLWDIPPSVNSLPEGLPSGFELTDPAGAHQVSNMGTDKHAYYGPCSAGAAAATYEYRLYALNKDKLDLTESSTGPEAQSAVEAAMLEMTVWSGKPAQ